MNAIQTSRKPNRARRCGLLTIRESPEIGTPLEDIKFERIRDRRKMEHFGEDRESPENEINLPEDDSQLEGVSQELLELKNRAKKLSEELKQLSSAAEDLKANSQDHSEDFNEIMRRYSDFVSSPDDNEEESERKVAEMLQKFGDSSFNSSTSESNIDEMKNPDEDGLKVSESPVLTEMDSQNYAVEGLSGQPERFDSSNEDQHNLVSENRSSFSIPKINIEYEDEDAVPFVSEPYEEQEIESDCQPKDKPDSSINVSIDEIVDDEKLFKPIMILTEESNVGDIDVDALEAVTLKEMNMDLTATILRENLDLDENYHLEIQKLSTENGLIEIVNEESGREALNIEIPNQNLQIDNLSLETSISSSEQENSRNSAFKPFENDEKRISNISEKPTFSKSQRKVRFVSPETKRNEEMNKTQDLKNFIKKSALDNMMRKRQTEKDSTSKDPVYENTEKLQPADLKTEEELENDAIEEALEMIRNFKPKRKQTPGPRFPDLGLEGEKYLRGRKPGFTHWHMPFRHEAFQNRFEGDKGEDVGEIFDVDMFTPTGDIYSYFIRRRLEPAGFTAPLNYDMVEALGGHGRKYQLKN